MSKCVDNNCCQGGDFTYQASGTAYGYNNTRQEYTAVCGSGTVGDPVKVVVEAGKFHSDTSQTEADAAALAAAQAEAESKLYCKTA